MSETRTRVEFIDQISRDRLWSDLERFVQYDRLSGTDGDHNAADFIAERLQEFGVPVQVYEHQAYLSYPRRSNLELLRPEPRGFNTLTHSFSPTTSPEGVVGELIAVGTGRPEDYLGIDVTGKIVLIDQLATPERAIVAEVKGAKAAVFVSQERVIHNMTMTTVWGTPSPEQADRLPRMPGVSVVKSDGDHLRRLLTEGPVTVRVVAETWIGWKTLKLPIVDIEGSVEDTFLLVAGHYDSWHYGATDNGTGDVCLMELARVLWNNRELLRRGVRIAWWSGHSHGRYAGSAWYADRFWEDLDDRCVGLLNIDNPGCRPSTSTKYRYCRLYPTAVRGCRGIK